MPHSNPFEWNIEGDAQSEIDQQMKDLARLYARTFSTPEGQKVLENLERLLERPCTQPEAGLNGIPIAYFRDGQQETVRMIKRLVKLGKE